MSRRLAAPIAAAAFAATALACTSGPGRLPSFADASERFDAGFLDANPRPDAAPDAGPPDDSEVVLFDSGVPPTMFPFTGQFVIMGEQNRLFAREVAGRLSLIWGSQPFVYEGEISEDGTFSVSSGALQRSGCPVARLSGSYQRLSATIFFTAEGCDANGPFTTNGLRGFFEADYDPQFSGIYQIAGVVMTNEFNCYQGPNNVMEMIWAVNMLPGSNLVEVHVAADMIPGQAVYVGRLDTTTFAFAASQSVFAQPSRSDASMQGNLTRAGTDPPIIQGTRFVFDPQGQCYFSIGYQGLRVAEL